MIRPPRPFLAVAAALASIAVSEIALAREAPAPVWTAETQGPFAGEPILRGSRLFASSRDGGVYAFELSNGEQAWRVAGEGKPIGGPSLAAALIVWADEAGNLTAVHAHDGRLIWKKPLPAKAAAPALATTQGVIVGLTDGTLRCFGVTAGKPKWKAKVGTPPFGPLVASKNFVVVCGKTGSLAGVDPLTGKIRWRSLLSQPPSPGLVCAGDFVFACPGGTSVCCVDARTGRPRWARPLPFHATRVTPLDAGRMVAVSGAGALRLYELKTGVCVLDLPADPSRAGCDLFALDPHNVLAGSPSGALSLWFLSAVESEMRPAKSTPRGVAIETWSGQVARGAISAVATDAHRLYALSSDGLIYALPLK